ncbi:MAG: SPOR domain-containing protein [Deltaproteobacteria bacterium]|nr:SPOR domain-containing protein [Deltaproteobacteria bacterium]
MKQHKNILLIILLAASALAVLGLSFQVGKMLSRAYRETTAQAPAQESVKRSAGEIPQTAALPKAESPAVKEAAKSGTVDSTSKMVPAPAPGPVGKVGASAPKKEESQRPAEATKPAATAAASGAPPASKEAKAEKPPQAAKPAAKTATESAATVQPTAKPPEPVPSAAAAGAPVVQAAAKPPEPAPEQKPEAKAPKKSKEYKVVAESFSAEADAGKLADRLKAENYTPVIVPADLSQKGRYYRVIVGSHGSLNEARAQMTELKKLGLQPFLIAE